ncbi:MAG: calcium-binding protein, partial [Pseudomonadota bacterium]
NGTNDTLTVTNWFKDESTEWRVEQISFADGTVWDADAIAQMVLQGTDNDDAITGYATADTLAGLGGNDVLSGRGSSDGLDGGPGTDFLYGGYKDEDKLNPNAGNGPDELYGEDGADTLLGGADADKLVGGNGADFLDGQGGSDTMFGGSDNELRRYMGPNGDDTYGFGYESGQDVVVDRDKTPGNVDTILLHEDVAAADVIVRRSKDDLVLSLNGTVDTLTVTNWFKDESTEWRVERVSFADGTVWDADAIAQMVLQGTDNDDAITGYATADTLAGLGGNDVLSGRGSSDVLDGGPGTDFLYGGYKYEDKLNPNAGNGNDTYSFGLDYDNDVVVDYDKTPGNTDVIQMTADVAPADVIVRRGGNGVDLVLFVRSADTVDSITVKNWFLEGTDAWQVEEVRFADGTVWDVAAIKEQAIAGTDHDDALIGYDTPDIINGLAGRDEISAGGGDDSIDPGSGDDYAAGGTGSDDYKFGRDSDNDVIVENDYTPGNMDRIVFDPDVAPSDITLNRIGNDLFVSINDTADGLQLVQWFTDDAHKVEQLVFSDGTVWDADAIIQATLPAPSANDAADADEEMLQRRNSPLQPYSACSSAFSASCADGMLLRRQQRRNSRVDISGSSGAMSAAGVDEAA